MSQVESKVQSRAAVRRYAPRRYSHEDIRHARLVALGTSALFARRLAARKGSPTRHDFDAARLACIAATDEALPGAMAAMQDLINAEYEANEEVDRIDLAMPEAIANEIAASIRERLGPSVEFYVYGGVFGNDAIPPGKQIEIQVAHSRTENCLVYSASESGFLSGHMAHVVDDVVLRLKGAQKSA